MKDALDLALGRFDNAEITVEDGVMVIVAEADGCSVLARANKVWIDGDGVRWELNEMPTNDPLGNAVSLTVEQPVVRLPLRIGGVMRCCMQTLDTIGPPASTTEEGDTLPCLYCSSGLIVRDGAWEWWQDKPTSSGRRGR